MTENGYLIIGAGPCGLYLGKKLAERNKNFLILEKSRGVGGRVATRRLEDKIADHGAPYLKFLPQLMDLLVELQIPGVKFDANGIFYEDGMTYLFKEMARHLPIKKEIKITNLEWKHPSWIATSDNGEKFQATQVIITAPLPQAIELLDSSGLDYKNKHDLKSVTYTKALMGLFVTDQEIVVKDTLAENVHSIFSMKHRSSEKVSVMRLSESFSETFFSHPDHELLSEIEKKFISSCESTGHITFRELKKWRYALPQTSLTVPFFEAAPQLYLGGDAFLYPDIRGALLSAEALAKKLI